MIRELLVDLWRVFVNPWVALTFASAIVALGAMALGMSSWWITWFSVVMTPAHLWLAWRWHVQEWGGTRDSEPGRRD